MSSFIHRNPSDLLAIGDTIINTIGTTGGAPWHVPEATITALGDADNDLTAAMNAQVAAQQAEKAATRLKNVKKDVVVGMLNALQATVASNPAITDTMLETIGFSRRGMGKAASMAIASVTKLTATPQVDGSVKLSWDRGGNAVTTMFVIETSADGAEWTLVKTVTRVSFTATGYKPGVPAFFRVTPTTSTTSGQPSLPVGIYLPPILPEVKLKVA